MFEKTVGSIKYGQSRDMGNIGHKSQGITTHKTKKMGTTQSNNCVNPGVRKRQTIPASYKTPAV